MTPTLIVTRPAPIAKAFVGQLRDRFGDQVRFITSPLLEIVPLPVADDLSEITGVIFTSAQAVDVLALPRGLTAWCVGPRTTERAKSAGFATITGPGDAAGLAQMIMQAAPCGRLAHIRGRHVQENVARRLNESGIPCADIIAYDQRPLTLTAESKNALKGKLPVVLPLFSTRTATILNEQGPFFAPLHVVVMSEQIKRAVGRMNAQTTGIAVQPSGRAMVDATVARLDALLKDNTEG
ncbi:MULTISPECIES: uroporphyrinogen-III synthase [Rhodobacterales]|uniref:uroporphyrinogen-III synthase n=1 Tax=Rhodobacterales TaxID=204455 RepID=UPI0015F0603F|nr:MULTISPECIES: uroporphyrinogen-III synthase [Rhodobacterales]MDO6590374.1 uroporphyrinogen-III synthase [Yoonia sp. 1_MG-2023]